MKVQDKLISTVDEEGQPINCPCCGKFMKTHAYIGEGSQELMSCSCVCGYKYITSY